MNNINTPVAKTTRVTVPASKQAVLSASQIGLSKDFPKAAVKKPVVPKKEKSFVKAKPAPKPGKPVGAVTIVGDLEKAKRPLMVSDMDYKQVFVREGKLCMRVLNVCNNNVKGRPSPRTSLWIVNLSEGKVQLSSDIPVELVDVEITVVNKVVK